MVRDVSKIYAEVNDPMTVRMFNGDELNQRFNLLFVTTSNIPLLSSLGWENCIMTVNETNGISGVSITTSPNKILGTDASGNLTWL